MLRYWIWLAELGLRCTTQLALLRHLGDPERVYLADGEEILLTEGITREQASRLKDHDLRTAERILSACEQLGQRILTIQDAEYPNRLRNIYDPPCVLYTKGRMPLFDEEAAVAVVGTRKCTPYGLSCAERMGYGLTREGGLVVSGLALGVDGAATRGALRAGGPTVGVAGCGLDVCYPKENRYLYDDVAAAGVLLSEYPPGTPPDGHHFPVRNRILSGLSVATLVVEAPESSGALITANLALDQGREVFAIPGPINTPSSAGCNRLIQESAAGLVIEAWDILREYTERFPGKLRPEEVPEEPSGKVPGKPRPAERVSSGARPAAKAETPPVLPAVKREDLTDDQAALLELLSPEEPMQADDLIDRSGIPTRRVLSALTVLELDGRVRQHSGKRYTRTAVLAD